MLSSPPDTYSNDGGTPLWYLKTDTIPIDKEAGTGIEVDNLPPRDYFEIGIRRHLLQDFKHNS